MAFVDDSQDPNKKNGQQGGGESSGGMLTFGSAPSPSAESGKQTNSGAWTNLQNYLDANSDQGAKMGADVAASLDKEAQGASDSLKANQSEFSDKMNSSGASLSQDQDFIDNSLKNASKMSDSDVARFNKDLNGQYEGPKDLSETSGWATTTANTDKAAQNLALTGSEAGRKTLLQNQYARPNYGWGLQNLDQLLLEGNSSAQKSLSNVNQKWAGINDQLNQAVSQAGQQAQQRTGDTQATNQYAKQALDTATSNFTHGIDQKVKDTNTQRHNTYNTDVSALETGILSPEQAQALGLSGQYTYGVDPSKFLSENPQVNKTQAASADDYANYMALSKLAGIDPTYLTAETQNQAGQLGSPVSFDKEGFQAAINSAKSAYDAAIAAANNYGVWQNGEGFTYGPSTWNNNWSPADKVAVLTQTRDTFVKGSPQWNWFNQGIADITNAINSYKPTSYLAVDGQAVPQQVYDAYTGKETNNSLAGAVPGNTGIDPGMGTPTTIPGQIEPRVVVSRNKPKSEGISDPVVWLQPDYENIGNKKPKMGG